MRGAEGREAVGRVFVLGDVKAQTGSVEVALWELNSGTRESWRDEVLGCGPFTFA